MIINNLTYYNFRKSNTFVPPVFSDTPRECQLGKDWWYTYETENFEYCFNSWAFRGEEYDQYIGKPVNICLGDSFTVNHGGPVEHSWPSQLAKYFDIPTINLGIHGAGNDVINLVYQKACEIFNVQHTFVMYSYFHRRLDDSELIKIVAADEENFNFFEKNLIKNVSFTFLPQWAWSPTEIQFIKTKYEKNFINFNDKIELKFIEKSLRKFICVNEYNAIRSSTWPTYSNFIKSNNVSDQIWSELFENAHSLLRIKFANRDGLHLNQQANKIVADYFLEKSKVDNCR